MTSEPNFTRTRIVKPRTRGYKYRPIISVVDGIGLLETGEIVRNLPIFAITSESHLWVTFAPVDLAREMRDYFGHYSWFSLGGSNAIDPDPSHKQLGIPKGYIHSFGFDSRKYGSAPGRRKTARHTICHPVRMLGKNKVEGFIENTHRSLQAFMCDVREWCHEQDLPMGKTLASLGASLLRDKRFWPDSRGRVPRATNERIRPFLPAVHNEIHADVHTVFDSVIALDQHRAYHTIAQEIATPDPTTLFARGRFTNPIEGKLWTVPGKQVYERTVNQPGLVAVRGVSRPTRTGEPRLPCLDFTGSKVIHLWTNEIALAQRQGFTIEGLTAAWTSRDSDSGLPLYGKWAIDRIGESSEYRRQWLKPTLHTTYGLLGARPRTIEFVEHQGESETVEWYFAGFRFTLHKRELENWLPVFANTAMLGVLQAEVRVRTLALAMDLISEGIQILHTHADGLHVVAEQIPMHDAFLGNRWTSDSLTRVIYEDKVSYLSKEKVCLPGRATRMRIETRRHYQQMVNARMRVHT